MKDIVEVISYDANWPLLFETEAKLIKNILGGNCVAIHHIGSTSVPGLSAKPIIDIVPVVKDILQVDQFTGAMASIGYDAKGEYGMPFRRYFQKTKDQSACNVHVFEEGNPEIDKYLKFRDWMRLHSEDRAAYAALKTELAVKYPNDIFNYCLGKEAFIANIDNKTGFAGLRMVQALTDREWESVRQLRQQYIFDRVPIADPYTCTFKNSQHLHLVLYKGITIMGYAHIQLWPESRAAMKIIVIAEPYRNQGIGSDFLRKCERWLSHQKMKMLLAQSPPEAYQFYCKNGYIKMAFNDPNGNASDPRAIEVGKIF